MIDGREKEKDIDMGLDLGDIDEIQNTSASGSSILFKGSFRGFSPRSLPTRASSVCRDDFSRRSSKPHEKSLVVFRYPDYLRNIENGNGS